MLDSKTFNNLINVTGNNDNPLITVEKINILEGKLDIYITYNDPQLSNLINNVTNLVNDFLANNNLAIDDFNISDPEQAELIEELLDSLGEISNVINNNEDLSHEQIDNLINLINQLDDENLNTFIELFETEINDSQLLDLYDMLFGQIS